MVKGTAGRRRLRWLGRRSCDTRLSCSATAQGRRWASCRPVAKAHKPKAVREEKTWDVLGDLN
jgi:hypothetical protein